MNTMTIPSSKPIETFTKNGKPVWNIVKPTQYIMSEMENVLKSLFLNVDVNDLKTFSFDGFVSTNSFSFNKNVGKSMQTQAMTAKTMKQIR